MRHFLTHFNVLKFVDFEILVKQIIPRKVVIPSYYNADLGEEEWRGIAQVLGLKKEVKVTWHHDDIAVGESDGQMLDESIVSLAQVRQVQAELLVFVILPLSDVRLLNEHYQTLHE